MKQLEKFDVQPHLTSKALLLRPLVSDDFDGLYQAASDPVTWAGHPARDRHFKEVFQPYFQSLLSSGSALVVLDRTSRSIIGCSRYYTAPDRPGTISIGFTFLAPAYWGGEVNFELKRLMLDHAFTTYPDVWFHIDPTNIRSRKATMKLGAHAVHDAVLNLSAGPAEWKCYCLSRQDWQSTCNSRA